MDTIALPGSETMRVTTSNGGRWRLGRRRLAWRPPGLSGLTNILHVPIDLDDGIGIAILLLVVVVVVPFVLYYCISWLLVLLVSPFVALLRAMGLAKVRVVARPMRGTSSDFRGEWRRKVPAAHADALVARVAGEIAYYGCPASLLHP